MSDDKDALFEHRWLEATAFNMDYYNFKQAGYLLSGIPAGAAIAAGFFAHPALFPLVLIPGRARDYVFKKHKESKKEQFLKPIEYPKFKI